MLAGGDREAELFRIGIRRGQGAGAAGRAGGITRLKAIVIPVIGFETFCFDVDRETKRGSCGGFTGRDNLFEGIVGRDFPVDFEGVVGHAATGFEWLGAEACPENDALMIRVAGGHSHREWISRKINFFWGSCGLAEQRNCGEGSGVGQEESS